MMECKAAIALNNMGVDMMSHSCHEQAFKTLNDATVIIKYASATIAKDVPVAPLNMDSKTRAANVQEKLQQAFHRSSIPVKTSFSEESPVSLELMSHSDSSLCVDDFPGLAAYSTVDGIDLNSLIQRDLTRSSIIHIDTNDFELLSQENHLELVGAIILYNFAIASLNVAARKESVKQHASAASLRGGAMKLLTLSGGIFSELYQRCYERQDRQSSTSVQREVDHTMSRMVTCLSAIMLQKLIQVLVHLGRVMEAQECSNTLTNLLQITASTGESCQGGLKQYFNIKLSAAPAA